jgi:hypothetical protein
MGPHSGAHLQPEDHDFRRNPVTCILVTLALSAVFWVGLIWAAVRLYG